MRAMAIGVSLALFLSLGYPLAARAPAQATTDIATRTITSGPFTVGWSLANPEAVTYLSWNGSANLTATWIHPNCPQGGILEFFGNAWGLYGDERFVSPVGWGTTGTWTPDGQDAVAIASSSSMCFGTSSIPVATHFRFLGADTVSGRIEIERAFEFGTTPFTADLRPFIPRLSLAAGFLTILHPDAAGAKLVAHSATQCWWGCEERNWDGTWYAIENPATGLGMVVRHEGSATSTSLFIDDDAGSGTTATAVLLHQPAGGFTGTLVDREVVCFYDSSTWRHSVTPPVACSQSWSGTSPSIGSKLGVAAAPGLWTTSTKLPARGSYVTWRSPMGIDTAGSVAGVLVAVRRADGTWGPFTQVTSRIADATGAVTYSRREFGARWISVRFALDGLSTRASQARWR